MAKATREKMMEKLGALEDKLFSIVPEKETDTPRAKLLDRVSQIVCGDAKSTIEEMQSIFKEGKALLAVEAEVKEPTEVKEEAKPKLNKKVAKKVDKKDTKKSVKKADKKEEPKEPDFEFPEVLETEENEYKQVEIKSLADITEDDLIACKWTEQDLKDYPYDYLEVGLGSPKKFEKDIDVLMVVDVYEDKVAYGLSVGTHKMYHILPEDIKEMSADGMPWRVYRISK